MTIVTAAAPAAKQSTSSRLVQSLSFESVKNEPLQRLTLFYFEGDAGVQELRDTIEVVAQSLFSSLPDFHFAEVDCSSPLNIHDCNSASFQKGSSWILTNLNEEGIVSYTAAGRRDSLNLIKYLRHKFLSSEPNKVIQFQSEQALFDRMDQFSLQQEEGEEEKEQLFPKPIFVKFWESWCTHCKQLKLIFEQGVLYFLDQIEFMEVECSNSKESKSFCEFNNITTFPTLILYDGESKTRFDGERNIGAFEEFFLKTLPVERFNQVAEQEEEDVKSIAATPSKTTVKASTKTKKVTKTSAAAKKSATPIISKIDDDDEEEKEEAPRKRRRKSSSSKSAIKQTNDEEEQEGEEETDEAPTSTPKQLTRQERRQERRKRWKAQREAELAQQQHDEL